MNTQIDFRTLPVSIPSLCIPRVFANIDEKRIRGIFDELAMGEIHRIDIVSKTTDKGEKFNRVFVHFRRWFANKNADTARERLLNGKEIKIIYDDPWFWKVSAYRETNPGSRPSNEKPAHKKASLQFDSDEDEPSRQTNHSSRNMDEYDRRPPRDERPREDRRHPRDERPREDRRHPRDERHREDRRPPRPNQRPRPREEVKKVVPRSPSNSPPRCREKHEDQPQTIPNVNYNNLPMPVNKRNIVVKKPLKIEEDKPIPAVANEKEEGEIEE